MNYFNKNSAGKCVSILAAGAMLLSSVSCGMIEMRDSEVETEYEEETAVLMLSPAERKNTVETRTETEAAPKAEPATTVNLVFTGDLRVDSSIIDDAANRAGAGQSYSFLRMYTGIFRLVGEADIAMASYSAADVPFGADSTVNTPIESVAALSEVGYDVLDTSGAENDADILYEYDILDIDANGDNSIQFLESNGLKFAYVSVDPGVDTYTEDVEYADFMSDIVVASVNWKDTAEADKKSVAVNLAEAGADVVIGNGNALEGIEWISASDGSKTLVAYSLGNLLATSNEVSELCGGILSMTVTARGDVLEIGSIVLEPSVVRYTAGGADYQLVLLKNYGEELSADHAVSGATSEAFVSYVRKAVAAEFLTPDLRG